MEKNIRIVQWMQLWFNFLPFASVFFLFLQSNGLTWQQVFIIESVFTGAALLSQFPAGMLADRYGRKTVLVSGLVIGTAGFIFYANAYSFWVFAFADALIGISTACHSCTCESIVYASLKEGGQERSYRRVIGRIQCFALWSTAVSSVAGGILATWNLRCALIATVPSYLFAIFFALQIDEPHVRGRKHVSFRQMLGGICANGWTLRSVIFTNAIFLVCAILFAWVAQPYQKAAGAPMWVIGATHSASMVLAGAASMLIHRLDRCIDERLLLLGILLILVAMLVGMGLIGGATGIAMLLVGRACFGAVSTLGSDMLHRLIDDGVRSRIQSLQACLSRSLLFLACFGFGPLLDAFTIDDVLVFMACAFFLFMGSALLMLHRSWMRGSHRVEE